MTTEQVAKTAYEVIRAFGRYLGEDVLPPWEEASEERRQAYREGVGFVLDNPDLGPDAQHNAWAAQKLAEGWTYGPEIDAEKKEHPCMVPHSDLPIEQQFKDVLFGTVVRASSP